MDSSRYRYAVDTSEFFKLAKAFRDSVAGNDSVSSYQKLVTYVAGMVKEATQTREAVEIDLIRKAVNLPPVVQPSFIECPHCVAMGDHLFVDLVGKEWEQWYFSDEAEQLQGPFLTKEEAKAQMSHYIKYILG